MVLYYGTVLVEDLTIGPKAGKVNYCQLSVEWIRGDDALANTFTRVFAWGLNSYLLNC